MADSINNNRAQFATRLGIIATTVGSAVGLGNIWRFPYEAGNNGGGAFLLCYILCIVILGIPVLCAEFAIGRSTQSNIFGAFRALKASGKWHWVGYIGILASIMILSFYSVVAGWTMEYLYQSIVGGLNFKNIDAFHSHFSTFSTSNWRPIMWTVLFLLCNYIIVVRGVKKGIEKMSNIMIPALFVLLIIFCINSLMMPNASEGLTFLFTPDFSKITPKVVVSALGQAFFSLSLGLGTMMTYGSYFSKDTHIVRSATITASLDTLVAILAGLIIFPAVFSFGMSPVQGPALVFEVLPSIFAQMPGGQIWSILFFFLLFLASLSSTISMSEVSIAFLSEEKKMSRTKASTLNLAVALVGGVLSALSFGYLSNLNFFGLFDINFFNFFDFTSSNILLPLGGMLISIFAGWILERSRLKDTLTNGGKIGVRTFSLLVLCLKYLAPICIMLIFLLGLGIF
ncbi:MAG: sodium-dependent transporter [Muribaculaceae bacterium]|nr:sodium-dependent transporter [Muribaculaceae bacterium]